MNPKEEAEARLQHTKEGVRLKKDLENIDRALTIIDNMPGDLPELERLVESSAGLYEFKAGVDLTSCFVLCVKANVKKLASNLVKLRAAIVEDLRKWEIKKSWFSQLKKTDESLKGS